MMGKRLFLASALSVSLITSGIVSFSVSPSTKVEAAEKTALQIWGDAKWYYNNQSYYNSVYYGNDAIKKGYKGADKESFMQKAGQSLFNSATAASDKKDYKLAYKYYNLVATASGISAPLQKEGAKYAEISKMRAEQPEVAEYFNQAQWYLNQQSYYNALYFITRTIESGWNTPLIKEYVTTISTSLLEDAKYSVQVDNKQDALKSCEVLIQNPYVSTATKNAAAKLKLDILNPKNFSVTEKQLLTRGYPTEAIIALSTEQEKDLINEDATYIETKENEGTDSTFLEQPTAEEGTAQTKASEASALSKSKVDYSKDGKDGLKNFYQKIVVSKLKPAASGKYKGMPSVKLTYIIDWRETPILSFTDKLGLNWSKEYYADQDTSKIQYTYYTYKKKYVTAARSGRSSVSDIKKSGVGWKYDIKGDDGRAYVIKHHVETNITLRNGNNKLESFMYIGNYFHKRFKIGDGNLTFGKGGADIGVTIGLGYSSSTPYSGIFNSKGK